MTSRTDKEALIALAESLWARSEMFRLSYPWTSPTRFEGRTREHFIELTRTQSTLKETLHPEQPAIAPRPAPR